jgi:hypothetical protein
MYSCTGIRLEAWKNGSMEKWTKWKHGKIDKMEAWKNGSGNNESMEEAWKNMEASCIVLLRLSASHCSSTYIRVPVAVS